MSSKHRLTLHLHVYLFVSSRVLISTSLEIEKRDRKRKKFRKFNLNQISQQREEYQKIYTLEQEGMKDMEQI